MFKVQEKKICGSSETIRQAPCFHFEFFYKYAHAKHVPRISEEFLEWFIGFFEGDGYIGFSKPYVFERCRNKKIYKEVACERLRFSICQKEKRIIEKIAYTFGFGSVSSFIINKKTYWRWTLNSNKAIENIAYLLSGNLILVERQKQFLKWIEVGQKKGLFKFPFDKKQPWTASIGLNNGWLSGFIDAESCFYVYCSIPSFLKKELDKLPKMKKKWSKDQHQIFKKVSQYKHKMRLYQKMSLTQISTRETNELFKQILFLFEGKSLSIFQNKTIKKMTNKNYVRIELSSVCSQKIIIDYLSKYNLKTIKNVTFKRWLRINRRRTEGVHLTLKATQRLYRLAKAINHHSNKLYD
jgi:hypothetical protein